MYTKDITITKDDILKYIIFNFQKRQIFMYT